MILRDIYIYLKGLGFRVIILVFLETHVSIYIYMCIYIYMYSPLGYIRRSPVETRTKNWLARLPMKGSGFKG